MKTWIIESFRRETDPFGARYQTLDKEEYADWHRLVEVDGTERRPIAESDVLAGVKILMALYEFGMVEPYRDARD